MGELVQRYCRTAVPVPVNFLFCYRGLPLSFHPEPDGMPVKIQRFIALLSVFIFLAKLVAWQMTHSVAILTDALESTVNVITGFIGLYSVYLAAKPRDHNHPFGHGKVEFISAAIEGTLILFTAVLIIYQSVLRLWSAQALEQLDIGIAIAGVAGVANYIAGTYAVRKGKLLKSATIEAAGRHLCADAASTFAILAGLGLLVLTGWQWLDSVVAIVFALFILFTGYRVLRKSLAGIMDESDEALLDDVIGYIQLHRRPQWIDMHNVRVLQYGNVMHIDAHMTLPWYYRVREGDREIHAVEALIQKRYGNKIEIFIHIDACVPASCKLCALENCPVRQEAFRKKVEWKAENVWEDAKHV